MKKTVWRIRGPEQYEAGTEGKGRPRPPKTPPGPSRMPPGPPQTLKMPHKSLSGPSRTVQNIENFKIVKKMSKKVGHGHPPWSLNTVARQTRESLAIVVELPRVAAVSRVALFNTYM